MQIDVNLSEDLSQQLGLMFSDLVTAQATSTAHIYATLISVGVLEKEQALDRMRGLADILDRDDRPLSSQIAGGLRAYADAISDGGDDGPVFRVIEGGKQD